MKHAFEYTHNKLLVYSVNKILKKKNMIYLTQILHKIKRKILYSTRICITSTMFTLHKTFNKKNRYFFCFNNEQGKEESFIAAK